MHQSSMIFESDRFIVFYTVDPVAYEIVDKTVPSIRYLNGPGYVAFDHRRIEWLRDTPTLEEVDATLELFTDLGSVPMTPQ